MEDVAVTMAQAGQLRFSERYDQNNFEGRFRKCWDLTDPRTLVPGAFFGMSLDEAKVRTNHFVSHSPRPFLSGPASACGTPFTPGQRTSSSRPGRRRREMTSGGWPRRSSATPSTQTQARWCRCPFAAPASCPLAPALCKCSAQTVRLCPAQPNRRPPIRPTGSACSCRRRRC
jgi:hypothetical protein